MKKCGYILERRSKAAKRKCANCGNYGYPPTGITVTGEGSMKGCTAGVAPSAGSSFKIIIGGAKLCTRVDPDNWCRHWRKRKD